jgi:hypothetical protein
VFLPQMAQKTQRKLSVKSVAMRFLPQMAQNPQRKLSVKSVAMRFLPQMAQNPQRKLSEQSVKSVAMCSCRRWRRKRRENYLSNL